MCFMILKIFVFFCVSTKESFAQVNPTALPLLSRRLPSLSYCRNHRCYSSFLLAALAQDSGSTALHYAVQRGDVDCVNLLLENGADPTIKNDLGKTPVDYCDAYPELRGALKRVIEQRKEGKSITLHRRDSTATDMKFPMYLVPLDQLQRLYGGKVPRHDRIEAHQELLRRGELVRWKDMESRLGRQFVDRSR